MGRDARPRRGSSLKDPRIQPGAHKAPQLVGRLKPDQADSWKSRALYHGHHPRFFSAPRSTSTFGAAPRLSASDAESAPARRHICASLIATRLLRAESLVLLSSSFSVRRSKKVRGFFACVCRSFLWIALYSSGSSPSGTYAWLATQQRCAPLCTCAKALHWTTTSAASEARRRRIVEQVLG